MSAGLFARFMEDAKRLRLHHQLGCAASGAFFAHDDLAVDALLESTYMGDDAHQTVAFGQSGQHPQRLLQRLVVQRAEPLVQKQGVQLDTRRRWIVPRPKGPVPRARDALKLSPPERVLTLRRVPL